MSTRRVLKEIKQLADNPIPHVLVQPNMDNFKEWYFIIFMIKDTAYERGVYLGKLLFEDFPFKPPAIYMYTPNGRFEVGMRLCLSISDYHPDTWNPGWSIGSVVNGLLSFMTTEDHTHGSITKIKPVKRKRLAEDSLAWCQSHEKFRQYFPEFIGDDARSKLLALIPEDQRPSGEPLKFAPPRNGRKDSSYSSENTSSGGAQHGGTDDEEDEYEGSFIGSDDEAPPSSRDYDDDDDDDSSSEVTSEDYMLLSVSSESSLSEPSPPPKRRRR